MSTITHDFERLEKFLFPQSVPNKERLNKYAELLLNEPDILNTYDLKIWNVLLKHGDSVFEPELKSKMYTCIVTRGILGFSFEERRLTSDILGKFSDVHIDLKSINASPFKRWWFFKEDLGIETDTEYLRFDSKDLIDDAVRTVLDSYDGKKMSSHLLLASGTNKLDLITEILKWGISGSINKADFNRVSNLASDYISEIQLSAEDTDYILKKIDENIDIKHMALDSIFEKKQRDAGSAFLFENMARFLKKFDSDSLFFKVTLKIINSACTEVCDRLKSESKNKIISQEIKSAMDTLLSNIADLTTEHPELKKELRSFILSATSKEFQPVEGMRSKNNTMFDRSKYWPAVNKISPSILSKNLGSYFYGNRFDGNSMFHNSNTGESSSFIIDLLEDVSLLRDSTYCDALCMWINQYIELEVDLEKNLKTRLFSEDPGGNINTSNMAILRFLISEPRLWTLDVLDDPQVLIFLSLCYINPGKNKSDNLRSWFNDNLIKFNPSHPLLDFIQNKTGLDLRDEYLDTAVNGKDGGIFLANAIWRHLLNQKNFNMESCLSTLEVIGYTNHLVATKNLYNLLINNYQTSNIEELKLPDLNLD